MYIIDSPDRASDNERDLEVGSGFLRGGVRPPIQVIVAFIDEHRHRWGVEPICHVLSEELDVKIAPGTYYAHKKRPPSPRAQRDAELKEEIMRIHADKRMRVSGLLT